MGHLVGWIIIEVSTVPNELKTKPTSKKSKHRHSIKLARTYSGKAEQKPNHKFSEFHPHHYHN